MTPLSEVAAAVAEALGLGNKKIKEHMFARTFYWSDERGRVLSVDGSNLTDPYWRCRCLDWLLEQDWQVHLIHNAGWLSKGDSEDLEMIDLLCSAEELPSRAIHAIMQERKRNFDPTPWCLVPGHAKREDCDCGPLAEND